MPEQAISLTGAVERFPVLTTGVRWPCVREERGPEPYFRTFPECRRDPRRNDYGNVTQWPPPFSRGGGYFPVLLLEDDGRLCCALRTGAPHAGSGSEISITFSTDRGATWSPYRVVVRSDPERCIDRRNPALGQTATGDLVMAYGGVLGYDADARRTISASHDQGVQGWMEVVRSSDRGLTWSPPARIAPPADTLLQPHGQMRRLAGGDLVFNARGSYTAEVYRRNPQAAQRVSFLFRSADGGATWRQHGFLGDGASETGFLPLDEHHWIGMVRHNDRPNRIAHSDDGGVTWTRWQETAAAAERSADGEPDDSFGAGDRRTVNRRSQTPAPGSVCRLPGGSGLPNGSRLPNGSVLITYGYRAYPFGVRAVVSRDGGASFEVACEYVLSDSAWCHDCGYPSTVCFDDGTIVTVDYSLLDLEHPEWGTCAIAYRYDQELFGPDAGR